MIALYYFGVALIAAIIIGGLIHNWWINRQPIALRGVIVNVDAAMVVVRFTIPLPLSGITEMEFDRREFPEQLCEMEVAVEVGLCRGRAETVKLLSSAAMQTNEIGDETNHLEQRAQRGRNVNVKSILNKAPDSEPDHSDVIE